MRLLHPILKRTRRAVVVGLMLLTAVAVAQNPPADVCTTIVRAALQAANNACSGTGRNQVCYGNILGHVTPAEGVTDVSFEQVGDVALLERISALQLSPLDEAAQQWGVALMQLQANLPDTLPGQNVTFLLFGDVTIEDGTGQQVRVATTVNTAANLRLAPSATSPVVGSVAASAPVAATGWATNQLGQTWVRVYYEDYRTATGWILAELTDVDLAAVPEVPADSLTLNPMQAFYFKTGIGQTQCAEAPASGVVVQTPHGVGKVNFTVNGIDIALGSTVFLSAPEGRSETCISLLTGDADLGASHRVVDLNPGEKSCAPLNADGSSGPPGPPEPFDPREMASIAMILDALPDQVEIPAPAPTRAPTRIPTAVPPTATPPPPATAVPPVPERPAPTEAAARYVQVSYSRTAATIVSVASGGPDVPVSYMWSDDEGEPDFSPSKTFLLYPGARFDVSLTACWSDGQCIEKILTLRVPECAIDFSLSAPVELHYMGGGEYVVQKADEHCDFVTIADIGQTNPDFTASGYGGERWRVADPNQAFESIWEETLNFWEPFAIYAYITDPSATPELRAAAPLTLIGTPPPPRP